MKASERFELIYAIIDGEITAEEAVKKMRIAEAVPLVLEGK